MMTGQFRRFCGCYGIAALFDPVRLGVGVRAREALKPPQSERFFAAGERHQALNLRSLGLKHPLTCGVSDGTRTRDIQDHNLTLYQLNYTHHGRAGPESLRA